MRGMVLGLVLAAGAFAPAAAEQANSVLEHYRAYAAALERGDLAAAEREAAAAYGASEARDGDGGRTGVLALNLALVRLNRDEAEAAAAPARRANDIAQARGAASGVDPLRARLALWQGEMALGLENAPAMLLAALQDAEARTDLDDDAYPAAVRLAHKALQLRQYDLARMAWSEAQRYAGGALGDVAFARAQARIGEAATMVLGSRREEVLAQSHAMLGDVLSALWPDVRRQMGEPTLTQADLLYAQALAWSALTRPRPRRGQSDESASEPADLVVPNECKIHWQFPHLQEAYRYYPQRALIAGIGGVVIVRVLLGDDGRITQTDVAAAAPEDLFDDAAKRFLADGVAQRADDAREGCVMPHAVFITMPFMVTSG
ncbi:MAG TPA: energy transducer TonB [Caulobacterales bacterium]|nr:energy transducer TonB [Caulobacterales bacterium]